MAPTDIAAHNNGGQTIHSALCLHLEHFGSTEFLPLGPQKLHDTRVQFNHVNTIIIDEISMVGFKLLTHVHKRLNELKGFSEDPSVFFGNMNVLARMHHAHMETVTMHTICIAHHALCITHTWRHSFILILFCQG